MMLSCVPPAQFFTYLLPSAHWELDVLAVLLLGSAQFPPPPADAGGEVKLAGEVRTQTRTGTSHEERLSVDSQTQTDVGFMKV
uniref:Uncharacterized protein n=1 Tax=Knipowitschia caucasica TaxID=637954 RepID=A0AAV2LTQ3_KNICA